MRFHDQAIRQVRYHRGGFPLFADTTDDGSLQILHSKAPSNQLENPTIGSGGEGPSHETSVETENRLRRMNGHGWSERKRELPHGFETATDGRGGLANGERGQTNSWSTVHASI